MQSDINDIITLASITRVILDKCERAPENPVHFLEIQQCRELCRRVMLAADRMLDKLEGEK